MKPILAGLSWIVMAIVCAAIGLAGGWYAARQGAAAGGGHDHGAHGAEGHDEKEGHDDHAGHDHGPPPLSEQALKNMGVVVTEAKSRKWARSVALPGVVEDLPSTLKTLTTPVSGRILEVRAAAGHLVDSNAVVVTILRDPTPLPALTLTSEIVRPAQEQFHEALKALRDSRRHVEQTKTELARLEAFAASGTEEGLPILPRKTMIDLKYELERAESNLAGARMELGKHGLSEAQVADIEAGKPVPQLGQRAWRQALELNGLWPAEATTLQQSLPENLRDLPWVVSTIGELAAAGRLDAGLAEWFDSDPKAAAHFVAIGAKLQQGSSIEEVMSLAAAGGFDATVSVSSPNGFPWDAVDVDVRPGDRVEAGARLLTLRNPFMVVIRAEAKGSDAAVLLKAFERGDSFDLLPVVDGAGPTFLSVKPMGLESDEDGGTIAELYAMNEPIDVRDGKGHGKHRSWRLRAGMRFRVLVPVAAAVNAIVVPADALVQDGADTVVFLEDGKGFKKGKVVVLHRDGESAALDGAHSEIFEGDRFVERGAFALSLALKAAEGGDKVDPHAGHNH